MSEYRWRSDANFGTAMETMVALHNSQVEELDAELARLRAANARLSAECEAWRRFHSADSYEAADAVDAARRAVDEAGDLR